MIRTLLALILLATASAPASAQSYPNRPIKLIVPFPPGGPIDVMARLLAQKLSASLGAMIVENRPGGGSTVGLKAVATAEPDGYTFLFGGTMTLSVIPVVTTSPEADLIRRMTPVALFSSTPFVLIVAPRVPANTLPEFVSYVKANPGKLNFGASIGTPPHISGEMFKVLTGTDIVFVPYKTAAAAASDALSGQIQLTFQGTTGIMPFIHTGKLRAIGVVSPQRIPELSDVPTMEEQGIKGMPPDAWQGIVAPAGTPTDIITKLNRVINEGLTTPQVRDGIIKLGGNPKLTSPAEFASFMATMKEEWAKVLKATGVTTIN